MAEGGHSLPIQQEVSYIPNEAGYPLHTAWVPAKGEFMELVLLRFVDDAGNATTVTMKPDHLLRAAANLVYVLGDLVEPGWEDGI